VNWVHDVQMCGILGENLSGQRMDRSHSLVSSGGGGGRAEQEGGRLFCWLMFGTDRTPSMTFLAKVGSLKRFFKDLSCNLVIITTF
jgi:hypothetical protein